MTRAKDLGRIKGLPTYLLVYPLGSWLFLVRSFTSRSGCTYIFRIYVVITQFVSSDNVLVLLK